MVDSSKPSVILVIGGPATGKSTYCKKLSEAFGFIHLSIGEVLREERKDTSTFEGKLLDKNMTEFEQTGKLMTSDIPSLFLLKAMQKNGWEKSVFLVDGFIKAPGGYYYWNDNIAPMVNTLFVLFLECPKEVMLKRLQVRAKTSGRLDDTDKLFDVRIKTYFGLTLPAVEYIKKEGKLILNEIPTHIGSMDDVFAKIRDAVIATLYN